MSRSFFIFLLLFHGLIHLMGFVKAFKLASINQLTQPIPKFFGLIWLLAFVLFIGVAVAFFLKKEWWWIIAAGAVFLSQFLIFIFWQDAKFGSITNILILIVGILAYGNWNFDKITGKELHLFQLNSPLKEGSVLPMERLTQLPPVVQKWLQQSNCIGRNIIQTVKLKQEGVMRIKPDGNWMSVDADQFFTVNKPGFIWIADVKGAPWMYFSGRDKYEAGRGNMLIKLFSLFTVADAKGEKTDQASLLRYLAEIIWFPSAAISDYISWEEIDAVSAKATMSYGGITASGLFRFNKGGDVISFEARRYFDHKEGPSLEIWCIANDEKSYRSFEGIRIPTKSMVTWKLKTGDFTWYKLEVSQVKYNGL